MSAGLLEQIKSLSSHWGDVSGPQLMGSGFLVAVFLVLAGIEAWRPMVERPIEARGRLRTNFALGFLNMALAALLPLTAPAAALWAQQAQIGLLNQIDIPVWASAVATVITASFAQYAFHRAAHAWPWLWRLHRAHHADTAVDLSTTLRNHPLELAVLAPWQCAVAIVVGQSAVVLIVYQTVAVAFGLWTHANVHLGARLDRWLRQVVVTPAMHHRHHSAYQPETDSNYGDIFPHWDRLFRTYDAAESDEVAVMRRGLGDAADAKAGRLRHQLVEVFRKS